MGVMKKLVWCGMKRSSSSGSSHSNEIQEGRIRVMVGKVKSEEVLFEMEANYLNHPLLAKLLQKTGEEHGYSYKGVLRIACDTHLFRYLLQLLSTGNSSAYYMDLPDLVSNFNFHCTT